MTATEPGSDIGPLRRWRFGLTVVIALALLAAGAVWWRAHGASAPGRQSGGVPCTWRSVSPVDPPPPVVNVGPSVKVVGPSSQYIVVSPQALPPVVTYAPGRFVGYPPAAAIPRSGSSMRLVTNLGTIVVALDAQRAPCIVASVRFLAGRDYFRDTSCHRLSTRDIYLLQCGDPTGSGLGGSGYRLKDENLPVVSPDPAAPTTQVRYSRGTVAMASNGPDTNGSQFFIVYRDSMLPPDFSIIGQVRTGLDVIDRVAAGGIQPGSDVNDSGDGVPRTPLTLTSVTVG